MKNPNLPFIQAYYPKYKRELQSGSVMLMSHSLEAPNKPGLARSLANGWWQNPNNETSVHNVSDSAECVQTFEYPYQVWGCGTGNAYVFQFEHVGYAHWSKSEWLKGTMVDVIANSAEAQAWVWYTEGIKARGYDFYPEWLTLSEVRAKKPGLLTHNDGRLAWGGTTHTDPGPNFPYELLRDNIHRSLDILTHKKTPVIPDTYKVKPGNTLSGIASKFHVNLKDLIKWNNIKDPNVIYVGQRIALKKNVKPKTEKEINMEIFDRLFGKSKMSMDAFNHIRTAVKNITNSKSEIETINNMVVYNKLLEGNATSEEYLHILRAKVNAERS